MFRQEKIAPLRRINHRDHLACCAAMRRINSGACVTGHLQHIQRGSVLDA